MPPELVVHADWSVHPGKRWMCAAVLDGGTYQIDVPTGVGDVGTLVSRVLQQAGRGRAVIGFDFPIGLPHAYAQEAGIESFLAVLPELGTGRWGHFYDVVDRAGEISLTRPFYPYSTGGKKRAELVNGLKLTGWNDLFRQCERAQDGRRAACPLFWTLGGNQVGRATIVGWRDVLAPTLQSPGLRVGVWPFDGDFGTLVATRPCVIVETYPAEVYQHLSFARADWSKKQQQGRKAQSAKLVEWARSRSVVLSPALEAAIHDGFGAGREADDAFDATVGLVGMLEVALGHRPAGAPQGTRVRRVEGWILGQT